MTVPNDPNDPNQQPAYAPPPPSYTTPPPPQAGSQFPSAPPVQPEYGYGQVAVAPPGMYLDQESGLVLPNGTALASPGRRIGAYVLSILLVIVTLVIGYLIWGLILWRRGQTPALKVLGMRVWRPADLKPPSFGYMALREIVGRIVDGIVSFITLIVSFVMMLSSKKRQTLHDIVAGTVVLHDPNKVIPGA
jgi:uncharacterized RDD family membrane protein YckC